MPVRSEDFELPPDLRSVERNDCLSPCLVRVVVALHVPTGRAEMPIVLVVEDETLVRELVAEELAEAGYIVVVANDADQAIAILEARQDINLVFTDIDMPGSMDGLKLAAAVRDRWPPVHIIITTGKAAATRNPRRAWPLAFDLVPRDDRTCRHG